MDTLLFVVIFICIFCGWYYNRFRERMALVAKLPGPFRWPIFGNAGLFIWKSPPEMVKIMTEVHRQFPRITCLMLGPQPEILITDPKLAEVVLGSQKLIDKSDEYGFFSDWLATGLLTATGNKWFARRKVITPAFHFKILDQFVEIFDKQSAVFVQNLAKSKGQPMDVFQPITLCALDIICETAMGVQIQAQTNSESVYVKAVKEISGLLFKRIFTFYLRNDFIFNLTPLKRRQDELLKILHGFTDDVIVSRREELMSGDQKSGEESHDNDDIGAKKKMAFLDVLLQSTINGKPLTNMDIREEVDTFMFEGHDTTSSGIAFCLYNLALHPEVQQKAYEEVMNVIGDDLDTPVTIKLLNDLNYLEMVIKETQRIYPSVPMYGRKMQENVDMNGFMIPKGSNIGISPFFMARDPTLWENPLQFNPERFASNKQYHPYLNVPFSAGPRNCIGQKFAMLEMKSTVSKVLRNFQLSVAPGYEPVLVVELILRPDNGVMLILNKRKP